MGRAIFLTGLPGSGKTTAIRTIVSRLSIRTGGFYTEEIRKGGKREGFKMITLDGQEGILAHINIRGTPRISKYGVDLACIERLAVGSLQSAMREGALVVIDEIGPMEILSHAFQRVVMEVLESEVDILGSIVKRSMPFADVVKGLPNVALLEIQQHSRLLIVEHVLALLEA
jgi:nucleoside-triphosphatase